MLRKNKLLILLLTLFLIGDLVLLFFLKSNSKENISADAKIIFLNDDKKINIEADLNNPEVTNYIQALSLFDLNGVVGINDLAYTMPTTIEKVFVYFEPTDQPWRWSRSTNGESYVSFDETREGNNLVLGVRVNYELFPDKKARIKQIQKDIEYSILFILTRHSTKISKGLISDEVNKYVVSAIKSAKTDFIKIRFNN